MKDNLTWADFLLAVDRVKVLWYATSTECKRGEVIYIRATENIPEFFVCHPLDLDRIKRGIGEKRKLFSIRDTAWETVIKPLPMRIGDWSKK